MSHIRRTRVAVAVSSSIRRNRSSYAFIANTFSKYTTYRTYCARQGPLRSFWRARDVVKILFEWHANRFLEEGRRKRKEKKVEFSYYRTSIRNVRGLSGTRTRNRKEGEKKKMDKNFPTRETYLYSVPEFGCHRGIEQRKYRHFSLYK